MTDLITFLRGRLDEDERGARYAMQAGGTGVWSEPTSGALLLEGVKGMDGLFGVGDSRITRHMAEWHPARVLAEVEAKRRILDEWQRHYVAEDVDYDRRRTDYNWAEALTLALRLLALPYVDHPDYDPEWRP